MTTPVRSKNDRLMPLLWPLVALLFWMLSFLSLSLTSFNDKPKKMTLKPPENNAQALLIRFQDEQVEAQQQSDTFEKVLLHVEAEDYNQISGIKTEICNDFGGGWNIARINSNDYCSYQIHIPNSGLYHCHFRIASASAGGTVSVFINQTSLFDLEVGNTKGWQEWKTLHQEAWLEEGDHKISLQFSGGDGFLMNMNWFEMELISSFSTESKQEKTESLELELVNQENDWIIHLQNYVEDFSSLEIKDLDGQIVFTQMISKIESDSIIILPKNKLSKGIYWLFLKGESLDLSKKILIL